MQSRRQCRHVAAQANTPARDRAVAAVVLTAMTAVMAWGALNGVLFVFAVAARVQHHLAG